MHNTITLIWTISFIIITFLYNDPFNIVPFKPLWKRLFFVWLFLGVFLISSYKDLLYDILGKKG